MSMSSDTSLMEPDQLDDLVICAQDGSQECTGRLFDLLANRVYRYVRMRVGTHEVAEDLTQTVFLEMIRSLHRYKRQEGTKFTTWLFQIARFRLIDHYRSAGQATLVDPEFHEGHPALRDDADPQDALGTDAVLEDALRQLPEQYQTVLHLRYREDLTTEEIAAVLDTNTGNVRVLQHRALNQLRTILDLDKL